MFTPQVPDRIPHRLGLLLYDRSERRGRLLAARDDFAQYAGRAHQLPQLLLVLAIELLHAQIESCTRARLDQLQANEHIRMLGGHERGFAPLRPASSDGFEQLLLPLVEGIEPFGRLQR